MNSVQIHLRVIALFQVTYETISSYLKANNNSLTFYLRLSFKLWEELDVQRTKIFFRFPIYYSLIPSQFLMNEIKIQILNSEIRV